jgi:large subunit ribosomal protein L29
MENGFMATTTQELRELSIQDLERRAEEMRTTLFEDRMKLRTGTLDSPAERTRHRRELARILTVLDQKKRAPAQG